MNGVLTFDAAMRLTPARRFAMVVVTGELKTGQVFNWRAKQFMELPT